MMPTIVSSAVSRCAAAWPPSAEHKLSSTTSSISRPRSVSPRARSASSIPPCESSPKKETAPETVSMAPTAIGSSGPTSTQPSGSSQCPSANAGIPSAASKISAKNKDFIVCPSPALKHPHKVYQNIQKTSQSQLPPGLSSNSTEWQRQRTSIHRPSATKPQPAAIRQRPGLQ